MIYISLLKGVNVGGKHKLPMADLRKVYENMGLEKVQSYLQSGNVLFADPENREASYWGPKISEMIKTGWGYEVPVLVLTLQELNAIIRENPMAADRDPAFLHVTFLMMRPDNPEGTARLEGLRGTDEQWIYGNRAIYLYCPGGYGNTKLNNGNIESRLGATATTRNWKTTTALMALGNDRLS